MTAPRLCCFRCGHVDDLPPGPNGEPPTPATDMVYACDQCGARIAFNVGQPRIVIEPNPIDTRFVNLRIDSLILVLDREYAHLFATDLLSVCPPPDAPQ